MVVWVFTCLSICLNICIPRHSLMPHTFHQTSLLATAMGPFMCPNYVKIVRKALLLFNVSVHAFKSSIKHDKWFFFGCNCRSHMQRHTQKEALWVNEVEIKPLASVCRPCGWLGQEVCAVGVRCSRAGLQYDAKTLSLQTHTVGFFNLVDPKRSS